MALGFGVWLARPFQRLEKAIVGLGENRLDLPIDIPGPPDVRRVSQQLEWLRLRLTELDADKARFLRHISHELKTPLASLHEGVAVLGDGVAGPLNPNQAEVVHILQHNTQLLQSQIEALLRFNAAAFEARQLKRERTDLRALLEDQVDAQRLHWQAHQLTVQVEGEPVFLHIDREKIASAVGNLLYFSANDGAGPVLWKTDGLTVNTVKVEDTPGVFVRNPTNLTAIASGLIFSAEAGTTPTRRPWASVTGIALSSWCSASEATRSWSVSSCTLGKWRLATWPTRVSRGSASRAASGTTPTRWSPASSTHTRSMHSLGCASSDGAGAVRGVLNGPTGIIAR